MGKMVFRNAFRRSAVNNVICHFKSQSKKERIREIFNVKFGIEKNEKLKDFYIINIV
jgi:hypothetical protein